MNNSREHIVAYNQNLYLNILRELLSKLERIETFIKGVGEYGNFNHIDNLTEYYSAIFSSVGLQNQIHFKIERIYKSVYLRNPDPHNKGNSYYHLTLKLSSDEIIWLDDLYGNLLSRVVKLYRHLFSKIDNYFISYNTEQLEKYKSVISKIKSEVEKFLEYTKHREIENKREKLSNQHLQNIPFGGLFYTAHIENIESILKLGILSHNIAHEKGVVNVDISNKQVNERRNRIEATLGGNIHDFAPLYINPKNPMLYYLCMNGKRENLILLSISPHILLHDDVSFSDGNAAVSSTRFYNNINDFNRLNWSVIKDNYWTKHPDGKRIMCSEVLVKNTIPIYFINSIYVYNENILNKILPLFPNHLGITTEINKNLFF